jgi:hypothetical protein
VNRPCVLVVIVAAAISAAAQEGGWHANPELVQQLSAKQPNVNYDERRVGSVDLPDVLASAKGTVRNPAGWPARRAEILDLFREHVYGRSPGKPDRLKFETVERNEKAMDGAATLERIAVLSSRQDRQHRFELTVFLPSRPGRVPLFLLLNNRPATNTDPTRREKSGFWPAEQMIARGYGIAALQVGDLAPDDNGKFREGVIRLFEGSSEGPRPPDAWVGRAGGLGVGRQPCARLLRD